MPASACKVWSLRWPAIIFSALSTSAPAVDPNASAITAVWSYVGALAFNLLVLVGAVKGCDRIVKEIMGL